MKVRLIPDGTWLERGHKGTGGHCCCRSKGQWVPEHDEGSGPVAYSLRALLAQATGGEKGSKGLLAALQTLKLRPAVLAALHKDAAQQ